MQRLPLALLARLLLLLMKHSISPLAFPRSGATTARSADIPGDDDGCRLPQRTNSLPANHESRNGGTPTDRTFLRPPSLARILVPSRRSLRLPGLLRESSIERRRRSDNATNNQCHQEHVCATAATRPPAINDLTAATRTHMLALRWRRLWRFRFTHLLAPRSHREA